MTIQSIMEYCRKLDELFKNLGFDNFRDFMKTAHPFTDWNQRENCSGKAMLLVDLYTDIDDVGYMFIIDKRSNDDSWYIYSINASLQMDTIRNPERVLVIGKTYLHNNGPLPSKQQIKEEVLKLVKMENIKEHAYKVENGLQEPIKRSHYH